MSADEENAEDIGCICSDCGSVQIPNGSGSDCQEISSEISGYQVFGYGIGHFYNDLCASMWFTYFLLFLEKVIGIRSPVAGFIMLIGQATDAVSTALIGVLSDTVSAPLCFRHSGRRKSWHVFGTVLVTFSFTFIYNKCFVCLKSKTDWDLFAWYAPFVIVFQIGWAAVQISHLSLLPELTSNESRRTTMNSVRYGGAVVANLYIFGILFILLHFDDSGSNIGPSDLNHFSTVAYTVIVLGLFTGIIFYITTDEPSRIDRAGEIAQQHQYRISVSLKSSILRWMCRFQFYQVGMLYMLCRLYINLSQIYFPFYIANLPNLSKKYVAVLPMVSFCSSLLVSSLIGIPSVNRRLSLEILALLGCSIGIINCVAMKLITNFPVYITAVLLGAAQATLLITSLSVVAKLISHETVSDQVIIFSTSQLSLFVLIYLFIAFL
ncbi:unnamed protein product [Thelazia callipaeda]|uniref:Major facilitator superfamily domain-containing protein 12 n=1 Tax=Thelazia callipaeda TaxID=103827 RepID=A0A0N5DBH9_THECL|nr:unnamed protein product [Thelazia callipaeda]